MNYNVVLNDLLQYKDLYNIPQSAFDNALNENEIESEDEEEYEREMEMEGDGDQYVMADSDDESIVSSLTGLLFIAVKMYCFQDSDSGKPEDFDADSSFESSEGSDIEVIAYSM